jgi:MFS family permease
MGQDGRVSFPSEEAPAAPTRQRRRLVVTAAVVALGVAVLGVAVGLVWRALSPRVEVIKVDQGFVYAQPQPEQAVAADGWFAIMGLVVGAALAVVAWVALRRHRGPAVLIGLVLGSLVGAWLAWWFAVWLEQADFEALARAAPIGAHLDAPLSLRMTDLDRHELWPPKVTGVVLVQALGAVVAYTALAGFAVDPELRPFSARQDAPLEPGDAAWPALDWPQTWPGPHTPAPESPAAEPVRTESDGGFSSGPGGTAGPPRWPAPPGSG